LIENNLSGSAIHHAVIGIGLNVNQEYFGDLNSLATSMKLQKNIDFDTALILASICSKLEKWYFKLKENKLDYIHSNYLSRLFGLNQIHHFIDNSGHSLYAEIMNVEENGKLLVKNANNDFLSFDIKEVKMSM
jgi:BirA family biotin operon repressor/biotin-[acetyl-CoA-carboxylase] ligase